MGKEIRKEAEKKVQVARIRQLMDEAQKREETYNKMQKTKQGSKEAAQGLKQAAMKEFVLRQQWAGHMTDAITNRLRIIQNSNANDTSEDQQDAVPSESGKENESGKDNEAADVESVASVNVNEIA